ncbi:MAG: 23S rRNA (guanosine(2251)-2'-O)-methyltransferase RlmB [Deltaproteobacteria bacterium]|nr:23S rRNA (guanosine(2251)-2'-O)-methyltransferase RlmB [Deltaproteobacteria bacterium]
MSQVLCGRHPVLHAVKAGRRKVERVTLSENIPEGEKAQILSLLKERKIPCEIKEAGYLSKIAPLERHQGFVAEVSDYPYVSLDEILQSAAPKKRGIVLVLDEVQDPQHLGALIRAACCFGVEGVMIPEGHASQITPTAARASSGGIEYLKIARISSIAKGLDRFKEAQFWVYGTEAEAKDSIENQDFNSQVALVIGSEGRGMRRLVREKCDLLVSIPISGPVTSLSASAAGAVALYTIARKQSQKIQ